MAYSGKYRVKNKNKYQGDHSNVIYRSMWEKMVFKWCDMSSHVVKWSSEEVVVPYLFEADNKYHRYFVDVKFSTDQGKTYLVEIKPKKETVPPVKGARKTKRYIQEAYTYVKNQNKWDAAIKYAKDRGWIFEIWTEETLIQMGIMAKPIKKMKKLKKLKPLKIKKP